MKTTATIKHGDGRTAIRVAVTPPAGERFSNVGMERAERLALATAHRIAAGILLDCPGRGVSAPDVRRLDTWAEEAATIVEVEHYGDAETIAYLAGIPAAVEAA